MRNIHPSNPPPPIRDAQRARRGCRRLAGALCAAGLLAGCATDQAADVRAHRDIVELPGPAPTHEPGAALSLVDAVLLANAYNERLAIEGEAYVQALAERRRRAAALLPTVDLFGTFIWRDSAGGQDSSGRRDRFDAGARAQYTLFTGLSDFRSVASAAADARARRWLLLDLREVLMLETARAYYEALNAERLIGVLDSSMALQDERLRDIRGRREVGFARPLDVAQIEAQASQTRVALIDARNQRERALATLALLTTADVAGSALTDGYEVAPSAPGLDEALAGAYARRQDLLAARAAADAARADVDAAIGQYFPAVSLNLEYFLTRDTNPTDLNLASLVAVNLPVFSAGRIEADVRAGWSVFREQVLFYSLVRREIRRDIETALADLAASQRRVDELRIQVGAAAEALRQAEASYHAGLGTNLERISAQDLLLTAQLQATAEDFRRKLAQLALLRAGGALAPALAGAPMPAPEPEELTAPSSPFVHTEGAPAPPPPHMPPPQAPAAGE